MNQLFLALFLLPSIAQSEESLDLNQPVRLFRKGKGEEAIQWLDRQIETNPKSLTLYRLRGRIRDELGHFEKAVSDYSKVLQLDPKASEIYQLRGCAHFKTGAVRKSIQDFDNFLKVHLDREPHHWQRGISYYYSGQYRDGVRQFEIHRKINPNDVENAFWHFLCNSRVIGVEQSRKHIM
ncbi:MAG: hypothetical protein QF886_21545, partial [Planctomycetota bacterium]|nr:hypothetical protein [Planctomycetota bacterium]